MNRFPTPTLALLLSISILGIAGLSGCQHPAPLVENASMDRTPIPQRPRQDIRELRSTLPGKTMKQVISILGQPKSIYTLDKREEWIYRQAAFDSFTKKEVNYLSLSFVDRKVKEVNFSY